MLFARGAASTTTATTTGLPVPATVASPLAFAMFPKTAVTAILALPFAAAAMLLGLSTGLRLIGCGLAGRRRRWCRRMAFRVLA